MVSACTVYWEEKNNMWANSDVDGGSVKQKKRKNEADVGR